MRRVLAVLLVSGCTAAQHPEPVSPSPDPPAAPPASSTMPVVASPPQIVPPPEAVAREPEPAPPPACEGDRVEVTLAMDDQACVVEMGEPYVEPVGIGVSVEPTRAKVAPGEALDLAVVYRNETSAPIELDFDAAREAARVGVRGGRPPPRGVMTPGFAVTAEDARRRAVRGQMVPPASPPPRRAARIVLAPHAAATARVRWVAVRTEPQTMSAPERAVPLPRGRYRLEIHTPLLGERAAERPPSVAIEVR